MPYPFELESGPLNYSFEVDIPTYGTGPTLLSSTAVKKAIKYNDTAAAAMCWGLHMDRIQDLLNTFFIGGINQEEFAQAIARWQKAHGLLVDGMLGEKTWKKMVEVMAGLLTPEVSFEYEGGEWEGEVNRSSTDYARWVQESLNKILGTRLVVDGTIAPLTRSAIRSFQTSKGLVVDGIVGPKTEAALVGAGAAPPPGTPASTPTLPATATDHFIVRGVALPAPAGLRVTNFQDPSVHRFRNPSPGRPVNELIIHETVTANHPDTVATLVARRLSVQMIVETDGRVYQHGDLGDDLLEHAGGTHNRVSVGVEVVNPFYPPIPAGGPWTQIIPAGWADRGRYMVSPLVQAEAVAQLVR